MEQTEFATRSRGRFSKHRGCWGWLTCHRVCGTPLSASLFSTCRSIVATASTTATTLCVHTTISLLLLYTYSVQFIPPWCLGVSPRTRRDRTISNWRPVICDFFRFWFPSTGGSGWEVTAGWKVGFLKRYRIWFFKKFVGVRNKCNGVVFTVWCTKILFSLWALSLGTFVRM